MNFKIFAAAALLAVASAGAPAQIATPTVKADLAARKAKVNRPEYFAILDRPDLTDEQRQALEVLYAYMPLPDMADNTGDFFLNNVDYSLRARREMPWGAKVPEREWRHFVLPVRINNEALDAHRPAFYNELKERVKGMSMADAILEINHWCHEKATYQPSDSRTHAPLATVSSAIGRCGEESTFTVGALRAMGIPARQIYTPRWAHTDDNHAWVEAWADGKWYFLGACEPEPVLNLGWFNAPASRGMMMNTRVFGNYDGPEEVLSRPDGYTEINVTENYAPVDTVRIAVVNPDGTPAPGARVTFRLYNYGEFYPIVRKEADSRGRTSLTTGLGDVIVWAVSPDGSRFGFAKGSSRSPELVTVTLDKDASTTGATEFDIIPPAPSNKPVEVTPAMQAENEARKVHEDAVRGAYTATFYTPERGAALGRRLGLDPERVSRVMVDARGNHATLEKFLEVAPAADRQRALRLLEVLSVKDRSDVTPDILADHLNGTAAYPDSLAPYLLSPRISDEALTPFRSFLAARFTPAKAAEMRANPQRLVEYVGKSVKIIPDWYPGNVRMSPMAVDASKVTNAASRDIYFVAAARTLGIPARIDPVTDKTQWLNAGGRWIDADFSDAPKADNAPQGTLKLDFTKTGRIDDPKYYTQFTVAKIVDGEPVLLGYPEDATWSSVFASGTPMDEGQYMIVSGQRMANGGVLARAELVQVTRDAVTEDSLILRQDEKGVQVIGSLNAEDLYKPLDGGAERSLLSTTGRGYYVLGLLTPNHEPTNHALRDIAALKADFEKWGRGMVLLFKDEQDASRFDAALLPEMPSTVTYGVDPDGKIAAEIAESLHLTSSERPIFVIADTFNRIVFVSQGYTIGLGEQLIDIIHQIEE